MCKAIRNYVSREIDVTILSHLQFLSETECPECLSGEKIKYGIHKCQGG